MIKTILKNEIKKLINRFPTDEELLSCAKYISENTLDTDGLKDIEYSISDWLDTEMAKCTNCGRWQLRKNMVEYGNEIFCDDICVYEWKNGFTMSQLEAEEYKAHVEK